VAANFAGSNHTWEKFVERLSIALSKIQEADQAANAAATMKNIETLEKPGH
jgi:hypothetical protein